LLITKFYRNMRFFINIQNK